jgi:metal-sulfur cluster biosynthetic enzyme
VNTPGIAEVLRTVYDPELGVDIVALGLVYGIDTSDGGIHVSMTTTTPLCPMGGALVAGVEDALQFAFPGLASEVRVVQEPVWEIGMIEESTRERLRIR